MIVEGPLVDAGGGSCRPIREGASVSRSDLHRIATDGMRLAERRPLARRRSPARAPVPLETLAMDRRTLLAAAAGLALAPRPAAARGTPSRGRAIDRIAGRLVRAGEPGMAIVVLRGGDVVHAGLHGLADQGARRPVTLDSRFHLASVGKQLTALAVLCLVQDGQVDLDARLARYLPELSRRHPAVTIRQVLTHRSGLPSYYPGENDHGFAVLARVIAKRGGDRAINADVAPTLAALPAAFPPGTAWAYANAGYDALGALVERVAQRSFAAFLRRRLFAPLGMTGALVAGDPEIERLPDIARGHRLPDGAKRSPERFERVDPATDPIRRGFDALGGSGGVYASPRDLIAYARAWDRGLPGFAPDLITAMRTPTRLATTGQRVDLGNGAGYGFGLALLRGSIPSVARVPVARATLRRLGPADFHNGAWPGFAAMLFRYPRSRITVILVLARDPLADDVAAAWGEPLETVLRDPAKVASFDQKLALEAAAPFL